MTAVSIGVLAQRRSGHSYGERCLTAVLQLPAANSSVKFSFAFDRTGLWIRESARFRNMLHRCSLVNEYVICYENGLASLSQACRLVHIYTGSPATCTQRMWGSNSALDVRLKVYKPTTPGAVLLRDECTFNRHSADKQRELLGSNVDACMYAPLIT